MYVDETEQPTEESKCLLMDPEWTAETSGTAEMLVDLSAAEMVVAENEDIEESKKGVPSKKKQCRCVEQKKNVIEAL